MKTLLVIALLVLGVAAQEAPPEPAITPDPEPYSWPTPEPTPEPTPICDHESNSAARFESVRLLPPLKIKNFDARSIEYLFEDRTGLHVGRLSLDEKTVMPANIWKEYKNKYYWVLWCTCGYVYSIVEVDPRQMSQERPKRIKP